MELFMQNIKRPTCPCQKPLTGKLFNSFLGCEKKRKRELYIQARTHSHVGGVCPTVKHLHTAGEEKILRGYISCLRSHTQ